MIDRAAPPSALPSNNAPDAGAAPTERIAAAARRDVYALLDRLPIGAIVLRGGEPLYLNRTLLDLAGYRDLAEFRAADGLTRMFSGRDAQTLAEASEGGAMPLVAAGGELIAVDGLVQSIQWDGAPATLIALRRSREVEYQERLRALEREARDLRRGARLEVLDAATDGVIALDAAGRILAMSRGRGLVRLRRQGSGERKLSHAVRAAKPERSGVPLRAGRADKDIARPGAARNSSPAIATVSRSRCCSRWRASPRRSRRLATARWFGI